MNVLITSKNFNTSDHLKQTIEDKFQKLGKYFSNEIAVNVTVGMEKNRQTLEATINVKGTIFRAEETSADIYTTIDQVVDKLSSQMSKYKTKLQKKHKDHKEILFQEVPDSSAEGLDLNIGKSKKFDLLPMSVEEAILQMELLQHTFFVFLNRESDNVNVVYKRKADDYGLLEPNY